MSPRNLTGTSPVSSPNTHSHSLVTLMKSLVTPFFVLATTALCLADAKQDVKAAAQKLADAPSYTWTTSSEIEGAQWTPATITGKTLKGSFAVVTSEREGTVTTAVIKGEKGVLQTDDGWKTAEELRNAGGGGGGGRGNRGAMLLRNRPPADEVLRMVDKVQELKSAEGVVSGDLTEQGAKELLTLGRGRSGGQTPPEAKNAKGSVKLWLKDGQLTKVQVKVSGSLSINGEDREMARTTTHEIKNVGTTEVKVPEAASKALGS